MNPESTMPLFRSLLLPLLSLSCLGRASALPMPAPGTDFIEHHCLDCHDTETAKGGLDLTALKFDLENTTNFTRWVSIYDQVRNGEMPPPKKRQPPRSETDTFLQALMTPLLAADTARHQRTGRAVLRRLNRTEYEYTLRDLLNLPHLSVREMIPADNEAHGLDTVGEALNLSYVQMTKYLETAELALGLAIEQELASRRGRVIESKTERKTGAQIGRFKVQNGEIQHHGDSRIVLRQPNSAQSPWRLGPLEPKVDGAYLIRVKSCGIYWANGKIQPADRAHSASLYADSGMLRRHLHTIDVRNDTPEVTERRVWLSAGDSIIIHFDSLDDRNEPIRNKKKGLPYSGPGIACDYFELEGPLPAHSLPTKHASLFGDLPVEKWSANSGLLEPTVPDGRGKRPNQKSAPLMVLSTAPERDALNLLQQFMTRAFRRPVTGDEAQIYLPLVREQLAQKRPFHDALRTGFKAVLCSPDFLFFRESPGRLDTHALASRLSYFIWKSMPDAPLLALARSGELSQPAVLKTVTDRMLDDPRSRRFTEDFLDQWLELRRIGFTEPDRQLYPEFTEQLQNSMVAETREFFASMLRDNLSADHLVQSDFTFLNGPLARLYGIPGIEGVALRRVMLPANSPRGGFLTQGSVLKVTANGTTTSPVTRGAWILERLLGHEVPPPPPGAGSIDPDLRGTTTIREQLAKHSTDKSCARCHVKIDAPGFALESFDVMGGWRDRYRSLGNGDPADRTVFDRPVSYKLGPRVDASGETADGERFRDIAEFRQLLLKDPDRLARSLAERLITYATGAGVGFIDQPQLESLVSQTAKQHHGVRSLVHGIVQSPLFRNK